jgi:hypothetical protein
MSSEPASTRAHETPAEQAAVLFVGAMLLGILLTLARIVSGSWRAVAGPLAGALVSLGIGLAIGRLLVRWRTKLPALWLWLGPPIIWGIAGVVWDAIEPPPGGRAVMLAWSGLMLSVVGWVARRRSASNPPAA